MDLSAIFLLLAVLLVVILYVTQPLAARQHRNSESEPGLSALLAERERLLNALQELDFDYALGKIPTGDYPSQRTALVQRGADILRRMDAFSQGLSSNGQQAAAEDGLEARIAARRGAKMQGSAASNISDEQLEDRIARRRAAHKEKIAGFCPRCGKPVVRTDVFCSGCGHRVK